MGAQDTERDDYIGVGLYSFPEAARIIGVQSSTLRRWARECQFTSRGKTDEHSSVIPRYFGPDEPTLTFLELIELLFVKLFRAEGVSLRAIRRASQRAAERFGTLYPFAAQRFDTDGTDLFATLRAESSDAEFVEDLTRGHHAFERVVRPFFHKIDYEDRQYALRYWPLEQEGRIVLDPQRVFGKPIDAETGIPTEALFDAVMAGDGQSDDDVAAWFGIPLAAVRAAVRYERVLREPLSSLAA